MTTWMQEQGENIRSLLAPQLRLQLRNSLMKPSCWNSMGRSYITSLMHTGYIGSLEWDRRVFVSTPHQWRSWTGEWVVVSTSSIPLPTTSLPSLALFPQSQISHPLPHSPLPSPHSPLPSPHSPLPSLFTHPNLMFLLRVSRKCLVSLVHTQARFLLRYYSEIYSIIYWWTYLWVWWNNLCSSNINLTIPLEWAITHMLYVSGYLDRDTSNCSVCPNQWPVKRVGILKSGCLRCVTQQWLWVECNPMHMRSTNCHIAFRGSFIYFRID